MRYLTSNRRDDRPSQFYFEDPADSENVAVIFANEAGGLTIAVSEERVAGSYNDTFECTTYLDRDAAIRLRDYLNTAFQIDTRVTV